MAEQSKKKTPKWLKALEAQSWQAELLISGLVIAGLLQIPDLFLYWVEGYMIDSTTMGFTFLKYASMYFLGGVVALIIFFGIHFLLRDIWVALLGLNSVYPNGINIESEAGSGPVHWKRTKENFQTYQHTTKVLTNNVV